MENQKGRISIRKAENAASSLPEIGKIKIGDKKVNAKGVEYPTALDYFKPTGTFANEFTKLFGDRPKMLNIAFISDDLGEVCNQRYECWEKGKRWGYSDGTTYTVWDLHANGGKGAYRDVIADTTENQQLIKSVGKWDEMLTLRFVLLEMKGIMGYWRFETKAKAVTIPSIVKSFDLVKEKAGSIIGFPFSLIVEKKVGYNPGEAKNYPVVTLVPNFTQDTLSMVREYIDMGGNMNRVTTKMIEQEQILQLLPAKPLEIGGGKAE